MQYELDTELPFVMLLDSLSLHDAKIIQGSIWNWLLFEWHKKNPNVVINYLLPIQMITPKGIVLLLALRYFVIFIFIFFKPYLLFLFLHVVPTQKNGFDCGLFVCRYALGIYKLQEQSFTYEDVCKGKTPLLKKIISF
jgi:hypothetical protein